MSTRLNSSRSTRVVLTGSESTGKSTLAVRLAEHYGAVLVPEFVRTFVEERGGNISFSDHGPIARGQMAVEDAALARGARLIVQDTDLLSTVVYCRHYFGRSPEWIEQEAHARRPDLYLLCDIDVEWMHDGVRDRGDRREEMQALFAAAVAASGTHTILIQGDSAQRFSRARTGIDVLLASGVPL